MKKYKFFALAFAAMTLAACSSDDVVDNGAKPGAVAPGEQGYVSLAINLPSQQGTTRATEDFDAGTDAESTVKSAYLLLFSGASEAAATFQSAYKLTNGSWTSTTGNVSATTKIVQQITRPTSGNNLYALVVLNGGGGTGDAIEAPATESETEGWKFGGQTLTANSTAFSALYSTDLTLNLADVTGSTDGFLMTNAPLSSKPGGATDPANPTIQTLAKVNTDFIYDTQAAAQAGVAAADVYVERAVAKVSVTASGTTGGNGNIAYTLSGFNLDVTNNKTFLVRNVSDGNNWWSLYSRDNTVTGANKYRFVGSAAVGTNLYRTYFGIDPNYNAAPASGDLATGVASTFNTTPKYCFENTFNVANMKQNATTHVVIAAELSGLKDKDKNAITGDFYTLYNDKDKLYAGIDDVKAQVLVEYLANATIDAILKDEKNIVSGKTVSAEDFDVTFDNTTTGGYINVATVTVKETSKTKFANSTVPADLESNDDVLDAVNSTLNIAYYKGGVSYYPVMIKHFGDAETPWAQSSTEPTVSYPTTNQDNNWLGRYGVLRNTSYNVTITGVKEIGYPETPGSYPGNYDDSVESWIGVTINMLPWSVRTQEVELK